MQIIIGARPTFVVSNIIISNESPSGVLNLVGRVDKIHIS